MCLEPPEPSSLSCFLQLFDQEKFADVCFIFDKAPLKSEDDCFVCPSLDGQTGDHPRAVILAHRVIIANRCPGLLIHLPELAAEQIKEHKGLIEIDLRERKILSKGSKEKRETTQTECSQYVSFYILLRFLYSGIMNLGMPREGGGDEQHNTTKRISEEEEAHLLREIMELAIVLDLKVLLRQMQPQLERQKRRAKKAHLLMSAF